MELVRLVRPAIDLVLPPRCPICGVLVDDDRQFCADCWQRLRFITEPMCRACGRPFAEDRGGMPICAPCLATPPIHDGVRAVVRYDDHARQVALKLKHGGRIGMAGLIAAMLARHLPEDAAGALLVPVPLHRWRLWRRGFNQAILIAAALSRDHGIALADDVLRRTRATPPLKGYSARERARIVRGVFALNPAWKDRLKGRHVLLIDDVYTSGATSHACTALLKRAGATRVTILCWARVLREGEEGAA